MFYRARRFLRAGRAVGTNRRRILPNTVGRVHTRSNEARFREVPPTHSMALAPRGSEADPLDAPGISPAHTPRTLHTASPVQQNVLLDPKSGDEGQQVAISVHCVLIISSAGPEMERSKMTQTGPRDGTEQNDTKGTPISRRRGDVARGGPGWGVHNRSSRGSDCVPRVIPTGNGI